MAETMYISEQPCAPLYASRSTNRGERKVLGTSDEPCPIRLHTLYAISQVSHNHLSGVPHPFLCPYVVLSHNLPCRDNIDQPSTTPAGRAICKRTSKRSVQTQVDMGRYELLRRRSQGKSSAVANLQKPLPHQGLLVEQA